jgi:F-type H+-transporting ATPase subunit gamma
MAGLKDIKNRIKSVESTEKLTSAMKLIATAKLKHSMHLSESLHDFKKTFMDAIVWANFGLDAENFEALAVRLPWFFFEENKDRVHVIFVIGANRGLCGNYNLTIVREALSLAKQISGQCKDQVERTVFVPLTLKTSEYFLKNEKDRMLSIPGLDFSGKQTSVDFAGFVTDYMFEAMKNQEWGAVSIVCGKFVNSLVQKAESVRIFPFFDEQNKKLFCRELGSNGEGEPAWRISPRIEPSNISMIKLLVDTIVRLQMSVAFAESQTCEQAARMVTMDSAKKNAENLIDTLTLQYNRTRQSNITNELIEIIAGTNAMQE